MNQAEPKVRYHLLDVIRGICIIYVVIYHALFNLTLFSDKINDFFYSGEMVYTRVFFVSLLILISGICSYLTRSNLKRGIKTLLAAYLVTLVTSIAMPSLKILFGILHFFGFAMILFAVLKPHLEEIPAYLGITLNIVLYILTYGFYHKTVKVDGSLFLFAMGFNTGHVSGDYYPIIPYIFLFLAGTFIGRAFALGDVPRIFKKNIIPPLAFVGRHTLLIYLAHQPILFGLTYLLSYYM